MLQQKHLHHILRRRFKECTRLLRRAQKMKRLLDKKILHMKAEVDILEFGSTMN